MVRAFFLSLALIAPPAAAEPRTVQLDVQKMFCATCPITVRLALRKVAGVIDAKVTLEPPVATVTYDDSKTSPVELTRATENAGFPSIVRKQP
jgi:periplasmic mercuric ion binding protein